MGLKKIIRDNNDGVPALGKVLEASVEVFPASVEHPADLPCLPFGISAGFPSPALDFMDVSIDLNTLLIEHPAATYFGRVQGDSMQEAGMADGDLIIIDKSLEPGHGKIAVCYLDGEFTLKRISIEKDALWLMPANDAYEPIRIEEGSNLSVWGIVTFIIKKPR